MIPLLYRLSYTAAFREGRYIAYFPLRVNHGIGTAQAGGFLRVSGRKRDVFVGRAADPAAAENA